MYSFRCRHKCLLGCISAIVVYLLFYTKKYFTHFDGTSYNTDANIIWEYVADFSNMKALNPTILDFSITSESGNYDHWEYTVHYTEFLSNIPFIHNNINAHFRVKPLSETEFIIHSVHKTCFIGSSFCLNSWSDFKFLKVEDDTYLVEEVVYECPIIFSYFCHSEVMYQRSKIFNNILDHFKQPNRA